MREQAREQKEEKSQERLAVIRIRILGGVHSS